jgi:hypothetical protein
MGAGSIDDLMKRVDQQFASQIARQAAPEPAAPVTVPDGIVAYHAMADGDTIITVTLFDTEDHCRKAAQGAEAIRLSLADFEVEEVETFVGEVMLSKVMARTPSGSADATT